jgi:hypothetical protein
MRRKVKAAKRVTAVTMAALLSFSLFPADNYGSLLIPSTVLAEETATAASGLEWSLDGVEAGSHESDFAVNGFTVKATSSKKVTVTAIDESDASAAVSSDTGKEFKRFLSLGGTGTTASRCVTFTLTSSATVSVYARSGGTSDRTLKVVDADGKDCGSLTAVANTNSTLTAETVELSAGTYYIYSGNSGINIYDIQVEAGLNLASALASATVGETTVDFTAGDFNFIANGNKVEVQDISEAASMVTSSDGLEFTRAFSLGGSGNKTKRAINFSLDNTTTLNVYALSGGAAVRTLIVADADGNQVTTIDVAEKSQSVNAAEITLPAGSYYIYSKSSGITVYNICKKPETPDITDWAEVATPVITDVKVNDEGNFEVTFDAQINKYTGAENVKISMLESGYEVSTQTVSSQKTTTVTFQPLWSGNYTFVAVAQRTGEADKSSEVISYDNYTLAVQKPVISWAQNKGNGSVYLDWVNISDADSYVVSYKEAGSEAAYTTAATLSGSEGNYTLTGLTAGKTYEVKVEAVRNSDGFVAYATREVEVTAEADQQWYVATVGSAQATDLTITEADGKETSISMSSKDSATTKENLTEAASIANTSGTVVMQGQDSGKISDDEDGFSYYFTKIDPNTENFKISATFEITDTSLTPDNQTGFGLVAADTLGVNNWGNPDYVHKYFNYASSMFYSSKSSNPVLRTVTGYTSADTSNNDGAERTVVNDKFSDITAGFAVGNKYTFTLEKTESGYTATVSDGTTVSEKTYADNSFTSVQEDGTVCVGIMVSRKVSVKVSDVTFTKSESAGVTSSDSSDSKVTPSGRIYSSGTCGASEYEYVYVPNCAGTITVSGPNGTVVENKAVAANEVVRVNVPINIGKNTVSSVFTPTASDNVTSTAPVNASIEVTCAKYGVEGETIIVSADGSANGLGTEESPLDIGTAVKYAQPGQTILMKNGVYTDWITIQRSVSGTAEKNITLVAESLSTDGTDGVVLDGVGLTVVGAYWHIYGLYVKDSTGVGIQVSGNYNTIEMCTINHAANTGLQISRYSSADNEAGINGKLWPTGNLIKNCESFDNCDSGRNDADGFAAKLTCGNDNKFYGCISHNNIDDGWDLYAKSVSGEIGAVTIENCVAYNNGWLTTDDITDPNYVYGEGNGFKLGGGYLKGGHTLINSISFGNHAKGITSNSCPDCKVINSISYNNSLDNSAYNIGLNTKDSNVKAWEVRGLISLNNTSNTKLEDLIPFSLHSENNYIYDGSASYNNKGVQATDDWFENVDITVAPERNADGTINMHGLLVLKDTAPADTGARLDTTSDAAKSVKPEKTTVVSSVQIGSDTEDTSNAGGDADDVTDNASGNDTDEEGSVTFDTVSTEGLAAATISSNAVIKTADGKEVAAADVKLVATSNLTEAEVKSVDEALKNNGVTISSTAGKAYYEVSLKSGDEVVKLADGSVRIVFAYPENIDYSKYTFNVYHIKDDGTVENLATSLSPNGIIVETESLSPFVVTYEVTADTSTPPTGDTMNAIPYVVVLLFAAVLIGYEFFRRKRSTNR